MRNTSKMTTLENRFPLLAVEHGCIISKDADITVAFEWNSGTLHRDGCGVRGDTQLLVQGYQGAAGLLRRPQTGLVHQGTLQPELQKDDMSFFKPLFRASLQRASVPEAHVLPLPDQDDKGA